MLISHLIHEIYCYIANFSTTFDIKAIYHWQRMCGQFWGTEDISARLEIFYINESLKFTKRSLCPIFFSQKNTGCAILSQMGRYHSLGEQRNSGLIPTQFMSVTSMDSWCAFCQHLLRKYSWIITGEFQVLVDAPIHKFILTYVVVIGSLYFVSRQLCLIPFTILLRWSLFWGWFTYLSLRKKT